MVRTITTDELRRSHEAQAKAREDMRRLRSRSALMYTTSLVRTWEAISLTRQLFVALGLTYAAVPLYRVFCSATGFSGTPMTDPSKYASPSRLTPSYHDPFNAEKETERIRVTFNANASDEIPWSFKPQQREIYVLPGETALTFYKAHNMSDKDIIGIATYNVSPDRVAPYFAKIECFCFEEQKLLAGEEVDLPVFFFLDKDMLEDRESRDVKDIVLSYTFFSARRNPVNGQLEYVASAGRRLTSGRTRICRSIKLARTSRVRRITGVSMASTAVTA